MSYQLASSLRQMFGGLTAWCSIFLLGIASLSASMALAKPEFNAGILSLPEVQIGDQVFSLDLELTDPNELVFTLDLDSLTEVTQQVHGACFAPYFAFDQAQLVVPVLELGSERFQVTLNLIDGDQLRFQVDPWIGVLLSIGVDSSPSFTVSQSGNQIVAQWGSPDDGAEGYRLWFAPHPSSTPMQMTDMGALNSITAELPPGSDYCLAISSYGPEGESDFSQFRRFNNLETPYTAFNTDDPALPMLLFPEQDDEVGMALMANAGSADQFTGAAFEDSNVDDLLLLSFVPDHGLLSRITYGEKVYHFVNYTATTVDVIETDDDGSYAVYPNILLSNHAIAVIEQLIAAQEAPQQATLLPSGLAQEKIQAADWARQGLDIALDLLLKAFADSQTELPAVLPQLQRLSAGFSADPFLAVAGEDTGPAAEEAAQYLDDLTAKFNCAGETGFACGFLAANHPDVQALIDDYPLTIGAVIQRLFDAVSGAGETRLLLNQDCESILDPQQQELCNTVQGNPDPGAEQEELLPVNDSQTDADTELLQTLESLLASVEVFVGASEMEGLLTLNELYFDYQDMIGERVWILGYYGDDSYNDDGYAFLLDSPTLLDVDRELPHHSFARLDGALPPASWNRSEVLVYGEISDFATESGLYVLQPTPLITVIDAIQLSPPVAFGEPGGAFLFDDLAAMVEPGTQASACDRVVVIAGGIDANNNKARYRQSVAEIYSKMKSLGFSDAQIDVFYNNGGAIDVGGNNIVDSAAGKQAILDRLAALKLEMTGSCTLSVFVSDHGTGYESGEAYGGARPAFSGVDGTTGMQYAENTFKFDAKAKAFRKSDSFVFGGDAYIVVKRADGTIRLYRREGESWVFKGSNGNDDNIVSESEVSIDLDGDGTVEDDIGFSVERLEARLNEAWTYRNNSWDSDRDGSDDVRLRWDGTRYVAERKDGAEWKEMGRDTDGDHDIDSEDGGVDWNLDGDKTDQVGFHEGINLWGKEVLWDDELAGALKELDDMGIHIMGYMASCFSGGFALNLQNVVENLFTGSAEDAVHWSRDDGTGKLIHDTKAFLDNLNGIDPASWTHAGDKAVEADAAAAGAEGKKNNYTRWETPRFDSNSKFQALEDGEYNIELDIPDSLEGQVYDFEFIFGLQQPRWNALAFGFPLGLPPGMDSELIPGGIRVFSDEPIPDGLKMKIKASEGSGSMRIGLTDVDHESFGYTLAGPGTVGLDSIVHVSEMSGTFTHFVGYSVIYPKVKVVDSQGEPVAGASVTISVEGSEYTEVTDANGEASFAHTIYYYGTYYVTVVSVSGDNIQYADVQNVVSDVSIVVE